SKWRSSSENGPSLLIPRENAHIIDAHRQNDEEGQASGKEVKSSSPSGENSGDESAPPNLMRNTSVFTWKNLSYTVKTPSGDRLLLDNVQGWVKPGNLTALMGSSGAGKTTL